MCPKAATRTFCFEKTAGHLQLVNGLRLATSKSKSYVSMKKGVPLEVNYHFPAALESSRFYWARTDGTFGIEPYTPPGVGETHVFNDP